MAQKKKAGNNALIKITNLLNNEHNITSCFLDLIAAMTCPAASFGSSPFSVVGSIRPYVFPLPVRALSERLVLIYPGLITVTSML